MIVNIPYIEDEIAIEIPKPNLSFDLQPAEIKAVEDIEQEIRTALTNPIGTRPLSEIVKSNQSIVIICDDNTRFTPVKEILPIILNILIEGGVSEEMIFVMVALGSHRPMTHEELERKFGEKALSRINIYQHDCRDTENLVDYGVTRRGTRVLVNRKVIEADVRIGIGSIIPHHPTGWSAGAKIVLPGVAGEETIAQMHFLGARDPHLGSVETEMRQEMEDFANEIGLDFIINTVLNREGNLVSIVAGHYKKAHRVGVVDAESVYGVEFQDRVDLTISSTSPVDFDFFQADKGIFVAELTTRSGGEIILVSGCKEGFSPAHSDLAEYGNISDEEIWAKYEQGLVKDPLTIAEAIMINHIKRLFTITIVSEGLTPEMARAMGFKHVSPKSLKDYIGKWTSQMPQGKIGILRQSTELLPILQGTSF